MKKNLYKNTRPQYFTAFFLCIFLFSCKQAQLIGKWHRLMPWSHNRQQSFAFNIDSTFLLHNEYSKDEKNMFMQIKLDDDNVKGTWKIINRYLITNINNNMGPVIIPTYKIIKLNQKKLILMDSIGNDKLIYFRTTQ